MDEKCAKCGKEVKGQEYAIATIVLSLSDWDPPTNDQEDGWWKKEGVLKKEIYCEGCYQPQSRESND
jgi:hypothetical protein